MLAASQATLADELVVVAEAGTGTYRIKYSAERTCDTQMSIQDAAGKIIFSEVIRNQCSFVRPYNLSQLPYGRYTLIASNDSGRKVTYIEHKPEEEVRVTYRVIKLKNNRYILQIPKSEHAQARVMITGSDTELYSNVLALKGDFACIFNLKNYGSGPVEFRVVPVR